MIKKLLYLFFMPLHSILFCSNFFLTVASINKELFYDNISGQSVEYWMRIPGMTSFAFMNYLNDIYQENYSEDFLQDTARIPLIVHQIWIGPKLPKHLIAMVSVWQQLPYPWQYKLWTEKEIDELGLINEDLYRSATNYAEKSDIVRYEILARFGGVYADCDVNLIRPEELQKLHMNYDFYAGLEQLSDQRTFSIGNSIIGCVPNHPIMYAMVKDMRSWNTMCQEYYQKEIENGRYIEKWEPTCLRTGPGYLSAMFFKHGVKDCTHRNIIFAPDTFYPYDFTQDKPDIIARHGYEGSWLKAKFNSLRDFYEWIFEFLSSVFCHGHVPPYYRRTA